MSMIDDLKGLKELLDCGALTQEEFDAEKKKILSAPQQAPQPAQEAIAPPPPPVAEAVPPAEEPASQPEDQPEMPPDGIVCPKCGSDNVTVSVNTYVKSKRRSFLWNLFMIVVTAGFWLLWMLIRRRKEKVVTQKTAVCGNCAYSWKPKRGTPAQRRKRLIIAGAVVAGLFVLGTIVSIFDRDKPGAEPPTQPAVAITDAQETQPAEDETTESPAIETTTETQTQTTTTKPTTTDGRERVTNMRYTITLSDGDTRSGAYTGYTLNGKPEDSNGRFEQDNGSVYVGAWKNGKRDGQGTLNSYTGDKYVGAFKNNDYHGQGTYTYSTGEKYVGDFKDGQMDGQGTYTLADGRKYVGAIQNGRKNGYGTLYDARGNILEQGRYRNDFFIG